MKPVSIGAAWTDANQFIKREAGLLFPLVLLFVAIPVALIFLSIPPEMRAMRIDQRGPQPQLPGASLLLILVCSLVVIGGTLSCYALAMKPNVSLAEALSHGIRRVPVALGAALIVGFGLGIPALLLTKLGGAAATTFMLVGAMLLSARLLLLNAVIVDRSVGPFKSLRASWDASRGNFGRLLLFVIVMTIPIMLGQAVAEVILGLIGLALGGPEAGRQAGDIGAAVALAIGQAYMIVMTVRIYRQLTG